MRAFAVPAAVIVALLAAVPASAETPTPPFVDHTEWVQWAQGTSLRVYPTPSARAAARQGVSGSDEAWSEVLAKAPGADTPGMR
ncbi:DUF2599 domain-containing protein, partial [Mycobacterium kyorinense]